MQRVKVSDKFQIVVPAEARRRLGIKAGDRLIVDVRRRHIVLMPEPGDYVDAFAGMHREVWDGVDVDEYLRREREGW